MENFMEYLELTPSMVNQCFNTVTREGQDQIFFPDVLEVIGYLEEAKLQKQEDFPLILGLNALEINLLLKSFDRLKGLKSLTKFEENISELKKQVLTQEICKDSQGQTKVLFEETSLAELFRLFKTCPDKLLDVLRSKQDQKREEFLQLKKTGFDCSFGPKGNPVPLCINFANCFLFSKNRFSSLINNKTNL